VKKGTNWPSESRVGTGRGELGCFDARHQGRGRTVFEKLETGGKKRDTE